MSLTVGVLALQGSFAEHVTSLSGLPDPNLTVVEVKTPASLAKCDGLIIPGGESTTMALVARRWGLIEPLREFAGKGRPVWGTCAGMIFLANAAVAGTKEGGQELIGGLDIGVSRNFFGAQINSFETRLPAPPSLQSVQRGVPRDNIKETFRAIFIRAPAVMHVGKDVEVLGEYKLIIIKGGQLTVEQVGAFGRSLGLGATKDFGAKHLTKNLVMTSDAAETHLRRFSSVVHHQAHNHFMEILEKSL